MLYGIKYGGVIHVGPPAKLVARLQRLHGDYVVMGEPVEGGWQRLVEPVDRAVLDQLENDYRVEIVL